MPSKTLRVEPELVIYHKGVKVFRTYLEDDFESPEMFVFTTRPQDTDSSSLYAFDVREWPHTDLVSTRPPRVTSDVAKLRGMDLVDYVTTPQHMESIARWEKWWDQELPCLIKHAIIKAIDLSIIS